jgi:hypothetical protein
MFAPPNVEAEAQDSLTSTPQAGKFSESTDLFEQAGKPLALLSQSQPVKDLIHETIDRTLEAIVFVSGFPPVVDRIRNSRVIVAAVAAKLGFKEIEARCGVDIHYIDEIVKVVCQFLLMSTGNDSYLSQGEARICSLQKILKEKAITHIMAQYKLQPGCRALVTALLGGRSYIFPGDMMNVCDFTDYGYTISDFYLLHIHTYTLFSHLQYKGMHHTVTRSSWLSLLKCSLKLSYPSEMPTLITSPTQLRVVTLVNARSPLQCWS